MKSKGKCHVVFGLLAAAVCFVYSPSIHAQIIASESFNYSTGSLNGDGPANGFSGSWVASPNVVVASGSLAYSGLLTQGNSLTATGTTAASNTYEVMPNNLAVAGNNIWLGFEIETTNPGSYGGLVLGKSTTAVGSQAGTQGIFIGYSGSAGLGVGANSVSGLAVGTGTTFTANTVEYMVADLDYTSATGGTLTLYLDPTPGQSTPNNELGSTNFTLGNFNQIALGTTSGSSFDEITIGDSYASISSAPEPTTASFLACSAVAGMFLILRRRSTSFPRPAALS